MPPLAAACNPMSWKLLSIYLSCQLIAERALSLIVPIVDVAWTAAPWASTRPSAIESYFLILRRPAPAPQAVHNAAPAACEDRAPEEEDDTREVRAAAVLGRLGFRPSLPASTERQGKAQSVTRCTTTLALRRL